jgi:diaminobutyrate-2-oxoglutarate transaminase
LLAQQAARESSARVYPGRLPVALARGRGAHVWDTSGRRYVDCLAGAGSLALGHHHPVVAGALRRALDDEAPLTTLDLATPLRDAFTDALVEALPPELAAGRILFCGPSGADAVEAAVKLCKIATRRCAIVAFGGGYHGMTQGALSLTGSREPKERLGALLPDVHHLPFPTGVRCPFGVGGEAGAERCARVFEWALEDVDSGIATPAAVVMEPVQGEGGVHPAPASFAHAVRDATLRAGVPLIFDEVQTGLGRTGTLWGLDALGVVPDVLVLSKAIGGGLPLAVVVARRELDAAWQPGDHAGTFRATSSRSRRGPRRSATSLTSACGSTPPRWARGCATGCEL